MIESELERHLALLRSASRKLSALESGQKNSILEKVADGLDASMDAILRANRADLERIDEQPSEKVNAAFRDRLTLTPERVKQMSNAIRAVQRLDDPVGEVVESRVLPNELKVRRVRAPLGAILMIFESRPNVITEVFALALKSGNAIALRGGSDSRETARLLYGIITDALRKEFGSNAIPFVGIEDYDRALVGRLLQRNDIFDICIPRGGSELIDRVTRESKMPVIKNDKGVCHLYLHEAGQIEMAVNIAVNGKTQRPGVCNALESILVDAKAASAFYTLLIPALEKRGVQFYACEKSLALLREIARTDHKESTWMTSVHPAQDADFYREYLDLKVNLKIVGGFADATAHIEKYGSHHSEAIITEDESVARRFQKEVDSACVYWNASTRFTDGFELGLGGEIGISTQKLHVRGPVGLKELTSPRWIFDGTGQVRL